MGFLVFCAYLSIVNLQWVELIWVFGEVGGAPVVACLLLIHTQEVVQGRVLVMKLVQLVASDGGTHSTPRPEHPVPAHRRQMGRDEAALQVACFCCSFGP